ncbi:YkvA family protein [Cupriavidus agavae]|uniref:Uncharacterized protein DUF1232 n=1 Tax=Cupriavidus agavae TaxID=1001822 RepID=A0A4Q7RAG6_9BURK|nr:YkvA family protein [Cupriavidus agavae]RZT28840.1 uncharacterized protein DUF1232 [Cupriavidus agavae]
MAIRTNLRAWARRIKRDGVTLWFASRHPGTPLLAKALCVFVVAYALSPIDLVPDFIPVLGYVDDVLLLPGLIWLAVKLMPDRVLADCRTQADRWFEARRDKPTSYLGIALVAGVWAAVIYAIWSALR